jgi:halimadienyl-diphosphate synthase
VFARYGKPIDIDALWRYELGDRFCCFRSEANPSVSVNTHMLGAWRQAGFDARHPAVQKIIAFLQRTQLIDMFWLDKWHVSPYYPTADAINVSAGYANNLVENAVKWMIGTQSSDGSWGYYMPTAEETAYCLQALIAWKQYGGWVPKDTMQRGLAWLVDHQIPPYPPLWVGKCLYCPTRVVRSAILSALMLREQL